MKHTLLVILVLFLPFFADCQALSGVVTDAATKNGIEGVTVVNKRTQYAVTTKPDGSFTAYYSPGDTLRFMIISHSATEVVTGTAPYIKPIKVSLQAADIMLNQVLISGRTKYQRDSAERRELYGHELDRPLVPKPVFMGLACAGCIGWLADKITGNSKKDKKFRKNYYKDDEQMFIASRYNPELIGLLTPISDSDSIAMFMYRYPMEYQYARVTTDLELKAWVRNNYRDYLHKKEEHN